MKALFSFLLILIIFSLHAQTKVLDHNGGAFDVHEGECLTDEQRASIEKTIRENIKSLYDLGTISAVNRSIVTEFAWPLEVDASLEWNNYFGISNYVDQDPSSGVGDYNCGTVTYNGHDGTDFFTWPFPHYLKENDLVRAIAGAPGTIVQKFDGQFDEQCNSNPSLTWNAVYVMHDDGSIAWYGHLKEGSLTSKAIGETVTTGEYLGVVASSGFSSGPHLHFEVHDDQGQIIDPYVGSCNDLNPESWWNEQPSYRQMELNLHATHSSPPEMGCPSSNEEMYLSDYFNNSELVYLAAYYKDQDPDVVVTYTVTDPFGGVWSTWEHSTPEFYTASWWWWNVQMPTIGGDGEWTYTIEFNGQQYDHSFFLGEPPSGLDGEHMDFISIGPNPAQDHLNILGDERILSMKIYNTTGQIQLSVEDFEDRIVDISTLNQGLFFIELITRSGSSGQQFVKD